MKKAPKFFLPVILLVIIIVAGLLAMKQMKYVSIDEDLGMKSDHPLNFHVYKDETGHIIEEGFAETTTYSLDEVKARVLFAESMYRLGTHGACGSMSILRGAMLRAAGIPEKTVVTIPLLYAYTSDRTRIVLQDQYYVRKYLDPKESEGVSAVDHFFNEVLIGSQWVRVDGEIDPGVWVMGADGPPAIKILDCHDPTDDHFYTYWNNATWLEKRPYTYVSVIEQEAVH